MDVKFGYIAIFSIALNIFFAINYFDVESNQTESNRSESIESASRPMASDAENGRIVLSDTVDLNDFYLSL